MRKQAMGVDPLGFIKDTKVPTPKIKLAAKKVTETATRDIPVDEPVVKEKKRAGRPVTNNRIISKTSQEGLPENWTRATYIVRETIVEQMKAVAYWERKQVKQVVEEAFHAYLSDKNVKPIPKR